MWPSHSRQPCSQHRCQASTVCRTFQGEDSAVQCSAVQCSGMLASVLPLCNINEKVVPCGTHDLSNGSAGIQRKEEIQTFKFTELSTMSTLLLQFNASQWGILIINDVDRNVYAETDIFFNWIITIFPLLLYFSASWKFCVPPALLRTAPSQPPFLSWTFIYIVEVFFSPSKR